VTRAALLGVPEEKLLASIRVTGHRSLVRSRIERVNECHNRVELFGRQIKCWHAGGRDTAHHDSMELFDGAGSNTAVARQSGRSVSTVRVGAMASRAELRKDLLTLGDLCRSRLRTRLSE
jgi:hypothetical protein